MAWRNGSYYRSIRQGRTVKKEYLGRGPEAIAAAEADQVARLERARRRVETAEERLAAASAALGRLSAPSADPAGCGP